MSDENGLSDEERAGVAIDWYTERGALEVARLINRGQPLDLQVLYFVRLELIAIALRERPSRPPTNAERGGIVG